MIYITLDQVVQFDETGEYLYVEINGEIFTLTHEEVIFVKQGSKLSWNK